MALSRITAPAALPVSLTEFRAHLWNIFDGHNTDALLTSLLDAATDKCETTIGRKLINQGWRTTTTTVSAAGIVLPFGNFQSLTKASWSDGTTWTDLETADTEVDDTGVLAVVYCTWPTEEIKQVRIDWICGYGATSANVPGDIKMAVKQLASHWYRMRSATTIEGEDGTARAVPFSYTALLHSHRLNFLG